MPEATTPQSPKRFLVFASDSYYPGGGWIDFISSHDTFEEAEKDRVAAHVPALARVSHIVDLNVGDIVIQQYEDNPPVIGE